MKICKPYKECDLTQLSQRFGVNVLPRQPKGHTGIDFSYKYGTFLVAPENVVVRSVIKANNINKDTTPLLRGYGIEMSSLENPTRVHLYWHCLPVFPVKVGDIVMQGEAVAQMGNSGFVMSGSNNEIVPVEVRTNAPYKGTHLHQEMRIDDKLVDPLRYIDFSIPIKYNIINAINRLFLI